MDLVIRMDSLQSIIAVLTFIGLLATLIFKIYKNVKKLDDISNRPYPCTNVIELVEKVETMENKYRRFFENDQSRLNEHDKEIALIQQDLKSVNTSMSDLRMEIKDVSGKIDRVLMILVQGGD